MGSEKINENTLKIFTLGHFAVMRGGVNLTREYSRSRRPWLLFQFLVSHSGKALPGEYVIETLWPEADIKNPQHSLRNLVYRLRRFLGDQNRDENYIIHTQGNYSFNPGSNYWLDIEAMEEMSEEAFALPDSDPQKINLLKQAYDLYGGEYLPAKPYEEWTIALRNYSQRLYIKIVMELSRLLWERGSWEEIQSICQRALEFEPFEENLHRYFVEALIKTDQKARAKNHYHQTNSFFQDELGVNLSFEIEELLNDSVETGQGSKPAVLNGLQDVLKENEEGDGAFLCDPENFRMIYQLEERRAERNLRRSSLASFQFMPAKGKKAPEEVMADRINKMKHILLKSLRKGDVVCPSQPGEFILLLVDVPPEKVDQILNRIAEKYYEENPDEDFRLNIKHRPLVKGTTIEN